MRSPEGRILVDGFFDSVVDVTDDDRRLIEQIPFDPDEVKAELGINGFFGEPGYSAPERLRARPTLEINGITADFQGEGIKTVLPARASAKITCRLVPIRIPTRSTASSSSTWPRTGPRGSLQLLEPCRSRPDRT